MRSRGAGVIGSRVYPLYGSASGVWNLGECFQWRKENTWPRLSLIIYQIASPADATVSGSTTITATITSTYPVVAYRWEKSTNGGATWSVVAGQTTESITLNGLTSSNDGDMYRLVATAGIRTLTSNSVTVWRDTIASLSWESPMTESTTVIAGQAAYFYAVANATGVSHAVYYWTFSSGTSALNTQWQQSTNGGSTWSDIAGMVNWYISLYPVDSSMNGYKYRAKVTIAGADYYSNAATLTVT